MLTTIKKILYNANFFIFHKTYGLNTPMLAVSSGNDYMHVMAKANASDVIESMLWSGGDPFFDNEESQNVMDVSIDADAIDVARVLLESESYGQRFIDYLNKVCGGETNLLDVYCTSGSISDRMYRLLREFGVRHSYEINAVDPEEYLGNVPLGEEVGQVPVQVGVLFAYRMHVGVGAEGGQEAVAPACCSSRADNRSGRNHHARRAIHDLGSKNCYGNKLAPK